jgi:cell wall-associated NlpC family hydrolase
MAISPLHSFPPAFALPEPVADKRGTGTAGSFDNVLTSLRSAAGNSGPAAQQAAADLFRIEMMQRSLALSGEARDGEPAASGLSALEGLLKPPALPTPSLGPLRPQARPSVPGPADGGKSPALQAYGQNDGASAIETTAASFLGTPYRFGGESADGIDCSSFVQKVFREHQVELPRTAREQIQMGSDVAPGELKKGDLVFFHTYASYPSHVGIYLGDGKMIHASSGKGEVTVSDLNSDYYRSRYIGAKRVV